MKKNDQPQEQELIPQFKSYVGEDDYIYIKRAFENRYIAEGKYAKEFQEKLLDIVRSNYGCLASNGTLALYLALKALGLKAGDEVIVQNITFIASANAVEMVGAKPVFADIVSYKDLTIDLSKIRLTKKTKALVLCPLFGTACSNVEEVRDFCHRNDLYLVEDASQALAIKNNSKHCGTYGKVGVFSFYADKTVTTGEGGFVVTDDANIYEKMLYLRNQGRKKSGTFIHPEIGYNFRMTDIQACLGLSQLSKLDYIKKEKVKIYQLYKTYLGESVEFLSLREDFSFIPFRVVVFVKNAQRTMEYMRSKNIEPRSMFYPLHKQPCYGFLGFKDGEFPNSLECFERGVCLPTWIGLSEEQIKYISQTMKEAL